MYIYIYIYRYIDIYVIRFGFVRKRRMISEYVDFRGEKNPRHDHTDHCSLLYCRVSEVVFFR